MFVKRTGKRAIENQVDIESSLTERKYDILTQTHKNLESQIDSWNSSNSVIATLGSDMSNLVFMRENTSLISLSPDWFGDRFFYNLACASKINWYEIRCGRKGTPSGSSDRFDNFYVDPMVLNDCCLMATS